jgi:hypothetical protein
VKIRLINYITIFSIFWCFSNVNADVRCTEIEGEKVCVNVGNGNPKPKVPIKIGGNGGCGTSSVCGSNHQDIPKEVQNKLPSPSKPPSK